MQVLAVLTADLAEKRRPGRVSLDGLRNVRQLDARHRLNRINDGYSTHPVLLSLGASKS